MRRPAPEAWAFVAAGASAGIAVVAFMAVPWPLDVLVVPAFVVWTVLLAALAGDERPAWSVLVVTLAIALVMDAAMSGLLELAT